MQKLSAVGKFHFAPPSRFTSLDHLVGAADQRQRNGKAEGLGSFQVDDQLDFGGLLDRQIGGFFSLWNLGGVAPRPPGWFRKFTPLTPPTPPPTHTTPFL